MIGKFDPLRTKINKKPSVRIFRTSCQFRTGFSQPAEKSSNKIKKRGLQKGYDKNGQKFPPRDRRYGISRSKHKHRYTLWLFERPSLTGSDGQRINGPRH